MGLMRRRRPPTGPGEILHEEFLLPLGMTQKQLADHVACDVKVINRIRERPHLGDCGDGAQARRRVSNQPGILAQRPESRGPLRRLGPDSETPAARAQGANIQERIASYALSFVVVQGVSEGTVLGTSSLSIRECRARQPDTAR